MRLYRAAYVMTKMYTSGCAFVPGSLFVSINDREYLNTPLGLCLVKEWYDVKQDSTEWSPLCQYLRLDSLCFI